jgi:hypothetical protein
MRGKNNTQQCYQVIPENWNVLSLTPGTAMIEHLRRVYSRMAGMIVGDAPGLTM